MPGGDAGCNDHKHSNISAIAVVHIKDAHILSLLCTKKIGQHFWCWQVTPWPCGHGFQPHIFLAGNTSESNVSLFLVQIVWDLRWFNQVLKHMQPHKQHQPPPPPQQQLSHSNAVLNNLHTSSYWGVNETAEFQLSTSSFFSMLTITFQTRRPQMSLGRSDHRIVVVTPLILKFGNFYVKSHGSVTVPYDPTYCWSDFLNKNAKKCNSKDLLNVIVFLSLQLPVLFQVVILCSTY